MILKGTEEYICEIPEITFGEIQFQEAEGAVCETVSVLSVTETEYRAYLAALMADEKYSWQKFSQQSLGGNTFMVFTQGDTALYVSYYPTVKQMRIVGEKDSAYLTFRDVTADENTPSLLTQIDLEDFGISYVIRLSDGRFIVFDGGWDFEPDADKLYQVLKEQSPVEVPRIAAWIFTHPHIDHYRCFLVFHEKYGEQVQVERFLYNFPALDDKTPVHMPDLGKEIPFLERLETAVAQTGAAVIRPHSGQVYEIANARMEILSCADDTYNFPSDANSTSLMLKMFIEGQSILFCADGYFKESLLPERYGSYLKSDILQIPHHGFCGGTAEGYCLIDPKVCLAPVLEDDALAYINIYMDHNRALIYDLDVQEFLTGGRGNVVLQLPYTPRPNGRKLMLDRIDEIQRSIGAKSWFFGEMKWDDCKFTFVNTTARKATIYAHLYFEQSSDIVLSIKITAGGRKFTRIDFDNPEDIESDALFFNRNSLAKKGVDREKDFVVHFISDVPVVIMGSKKPEYVY